MLARGRHAVRASRTQVRACRLLNRGGAPGVSRVVPDSPLWRLKRRGSSAAGLLLVTEAGFAHRVEQVHCIATNGEVNRRADGEA